MTQKRFDIEGRQVILHTEGPICTTASELLHSKVFEQVVALYCKSCQKQDAPQLGVFQSVFGPANCAESVTQLLIQLADMPLAEAAAAEPKLTPLLETQNRLRLHEFVEGLYDFWRSYDRFMVLHSEPGKSSFDRRPYRSFNATVETLTHIVRGTYRDICENITGDHPRIYRQVFAGCDVGLIAVSKPTKMPASYEAVLGDVPFIRHVWIAPPMIIDPPMNKRDGQFKRTDVNPLDGLTLEKDRWLCYPAQVGPLVIYIYFYQQQIDLACSMANLFELATDEQIQKGPDAVYCFGVNPEHMKRYSDNPTVFYDDEANGLLTAAVPNGAQFGYFGYLKKMVLTLHNIVMMKRGRMPYHGAMVRISLKNGKSANIVLIGDTAAGKSETLEAFRLLGREQIRELKIVADDMGSFDIGPDGRLLGYGTEIGAFIRLDDLQAGYAFEQLDRSIIMSPQKVNARVVLPVTTLEQVLHGYPIDMLLYANNYEQVDSDHPIIEFFKTPESAMKVFREGASMAKGTTTSTGLGHNYYANIFGPPQYRELHDGLAEKVFSQAFKSGVRVGQMRSRLGIPGFEASGPKAVAEELFKLISD
jgi:energy-coupling factor transporter ATP-binding protein EcfA2